MRLICKLVLILYTVSALSPLPCPALSPAVCVVAKRRILVDGSKGRQSIATRVGEPQQQRQTAATTRQQQQQRQRQRQGRTVAGLNGCRAKRLQGYTVAGLNGHWGDATLRHWGDATLRQRRRLTVLGSTSTAATTTAAARQCCAGMDGRIEAKAQHHSGGSRVGSWFWALQNTLRKVRPVGHHDKSNNSNSSSSSSNDNNETSKQWPAQFHKAHRPGRRSAASSASGRLVAATTTTPFPTAAGT
eukprot:234983-Chlamydomonas_euryale.AAC.2